MPEGFEESKESLNGYATFSFYKMEDVVEHLETTVQNVCLSICFHVFQVCAREIGTSVRDHGLVGVQFIGGAREMLHTHLMTI
ncbi:hypothetical protein D3C86_2103430 [compost metagenome]